MKRLLAGLCVAVCVFAAGASADVGITLTTLNVPRHGVVRGHGSGSGMAVYVVPLRDAPHRYVRNGSSYEPRVKRRPGPPFVLLGDLRSYRDIYERQTFSFRLPRSIKPGLYRVFLYCRPCGGSLIVSGGTFSGQVLRIH